MAAPTRLGFAEGRGTGRHAPAPALGKGGAGSWMAQYSPGRRMVVRELVEPVPELIL